MKVFIFILVLWLTPVWSAECQDFKFQEAPFTACTAKIPEDDIRLFLQDKTLLFLGNGKHAVSYPIKDKAFINFVFCINTEIFYEQDWTRKVDTSE